MLLNTETILNDSKKISELRKRTQITKHQENSWIPMAQYNSRTNAYVNFAMNLQAITSYNANHAYAYVAYEFGSNWVDLMAIGNANTYDEKGEAIENSSIGKNILAYTFSYTIHHLDWQIVDGTYVPGYYPPNHPDNLDDELFPMEVPDYDKFNPTPEPTQEPSKEPEISDEEEDKFVEDEINKFLNNK